MALIHILQVIGGNEIGGAEEHVLALCKGLDKSRFRSSLVCLCEGPLQALAQEQGITVFTIPMSNPLDLRVVRKLARLIRSQQVDIVHTHGSRANLTARLAARWLSLPIVTTVHSCLAQDYLTRPMAKLAMFLDCITTPLATRVVTISNFLQPEVKKRGARRTVTIYNGVDPARFDGIELADDIYHVLGLPPGVPLVGTVGRLHPVKGQKYFLEAAHLVSQTHPKVRFLLVGSGPLEKELRQMVEDLGLSDRVVFTGYVQEVQRVLAILDVLVLPSVSEGMGLVLLEAMFFGKPVVATQVGGIPELVKHLETGLLVPPGDPILLAASISRLLDDKVLASRLGANGKRCFLQGFSLDRMLERTQSLYLEVFSETRQP